MTPSDARIIRQLRSWQENFRLDGGTFTNDPSGPSGCVGQDDALPVEAFAFYVLLKITGAATPSGVYTSRVWQPPTSALSTGGSNFTESTLGTDPGSDDSYVVNLAEINTTSQHDLTNASNTKQKLFVGFPWMSASDGKPVYILTGAWFENCT